MAKKKKKEIVATVGLDGKIIKNNDNKEKNVVANVGLDGTITHISSNNDKASNNKPINNNLSRLREQESRIAANTVKDNINKQISQNIVQGTFQNDVRTKVTAPINNNNQISPENNGSSTPVTKDGLETQRNQLMSQKQLVEKKKQLEMELKNHKREEKVKYDSLKNVLYKTFIENQNNKYKKDKKYDKLKRKYDLVNEELENRIVNRESSNMSSLDKITNTVAGNLDTSRKGITSTIEKLTGQVPNLERDTIDERLSQEARKQSKGLEGAGLDVLGSMTRMIPQIMVSGATGSEKLALATGFANYGGSAYNEAKKNGASEKQATKYGLTIGALETGLEKVLGGFEGVYGKSAFGNATNKIMTNIIKNPTTRKIFSNASGEFTEEYLQEFLEPIVKNVILKEKNGADFWKASDLSSGVKQLSSQLFNSQNLYAGTLGAVTSGVTNGPIVASQNKTINNTLRNVKETINPNNVQEHIEQLMKKGFDKKSSQSIVNQALQETNQQPIINEKYSMLKAPMAVQYQETDNQKINNLRQSAVNEGMINNKKTQDAMNVIENIIADKDYNVSFDSTIINEQGKSVDGKISLNENGETDIKLNPNSDRAVEFLLTHEITHAIETKELRGLILDYAQKNNEFKTALQDLQKTYNTPDVSDEIIADISAQVLGNQEFINSLQQQNTQQSRGMIKTIYESIKRVLNKLTTKGRYKNFVQDLETKWREAYNIATSETVQENLDNSEKNKIMQNLKGKYVKADRQVIKGNDHLQWEKQVEKYINNSIREGKDVNIMTDDGEILTITKDTAGKAKFRNQITDKNGKTRYMNNKEFLSKLNAEVHVDELAQVSKKINKKPIPDYKNHSFAKDGFDYRNAYFEDFDGQYYRITMSVGKNGNINTIYNIGKMNKKNRSQSSLVAQRPSNNKVASNEDVTSTDINISQSNKKVKSDTSTKYSMQSNENNTQELDNGPFFYRGSHQIDDAKQITELNIDDIQSKIEEIDGYLTKQNESDLRKLKKILKSPNETVKIYRAAPVNELNSGDWVTTDKSYAKNVANENGGKVYSYEVKANELYYPNNIKDLPSLHRLSSFQYVENFNNTETNNDIRYSQKSPTWQEHLEKNYKSTGTKTYFDEMRDTTKKAIAPIHKEIKTLSNEIQELKQEINSNKQSDDLIKISKMNKEEASTTPKLPRVERNKPFADKESSFYSNVTEKSKFLSEESRKLISTDSDVQYYSGITNEQTMDQAYKSLQKEGKSATSKWFNKQSKDATAIDVAQGWILLKQYQDAEDYGSMVEVAKKMREIGTTSGQTVQAFNILSRLTPEGMVNYAQSELTEAYNQMVKNKTKNWIDKHRSDFELNSDEVQFIVDNMKEVQDMEDGYEKRVKLAEIQKLITDKLPTEKGRKIKSWMRISMLFNPKTQVRNVMGNALIAPVNYFGDIFASVADRQIAKKTGVRTTGNMNVKAILKGFKDGAYQATNDYKKGINTRDMEGNRFEIGEGKSFSEKNLIGKSLNRVDGLLNYIMDAGDRVFSQASFENSLQNQMKLNNTNEITQDMIDIARTESLQRTWNDNNNYTKFVLDVRRGLNKMGTKGYGLGDILIPFAKTPANLTKAIVDYSPAGLIQSMNEGVTLKRSLSNGQYNAQIQHNFAQKLGKATAGTMLYILGYALAKAKITSGESDDDKDVSNFMKNTLGVNSYSIKIGDKSFTYDWAQPLAAPLSITANIANKKYQNKSVKELAETIIDSLDTGGSILLEQSFLQSINDVLKSNDGVVSGLVNELLELPARAIPTFSKQVADMVDGTQRQTYVKGEPVKTALNSAKAKIPGVSKQLAPTVDTMGRDVKKYSGKNNVFNVFFNPANVNTENVSSAATEIYKVYQATDDKTIFPRVTPYSIDKIPLSTKQRADYQTISGELVEKSVNELIKNDDYKDLSNKDKAVVISKIVGYNSAKAKSKVLKTKMSRYWNSVNRYVDNGGTVAEYYLYKVVDD